MVWHSEKKQCQNISSLLMNWLLSNLTKDAWSVPVAREQLAVPFREWLTTGEAMGDGTGLVPPRPWHWWHVEPQLDALQLLLWHVHAAQSNPTRCPR